MDKPAMKNVAAAAALALAMGGAGAAGASITYTVNETILNGSVTGTVTTDGATGTLSASDVTAWNLLLQGGGASYALTNGNSVVFNFGTSGFYGPQSADLTATTTQLLFNYGGSDAGYFGFQSGGLYSGQHYWCNATHNQGFDCAVGESVVPVASNLPSSQYNTGRSGNQVIGYVSGGGVPEPATWLLMLTGVAALGSASRVRRGVAAF